MTVINTFWFRFALDVAALLFAISGARRMRKDPWGAVLPFAFMSACGIAGVYLWAVS